MSNHVKAEIILGLAILICVVFIGWDQYNKAIGNAVAEQTAQIKKEAQRQIDDTLSARDKKYESDMAQMDEKYKMLAKMTPQQVVVKAPEYIPALVGKPPIQIVGPTTQPAPTGSAIIPPEDVQPIAQAILDGQKCTIDYTKCQGDLKDYQAKYDLKDQESQAWEKAAKGGSWMKRLGKNVLKVGAGVAVGYVLAHR